MMKRTFLFPCFALLAIAGSAQAQTATIDGIEYTVNADGQTAAVTGADESITAAVVPATVGIGGTDYPVTAIGERGFFDCYALRSITLPEGLLATGSEAFRNCHSLESIVIPETVTDVGESAFYDCYELQTATLPSTLGIIHEYTFFGCPKLQSVNIPETVKEIGFNAFYRCLSLASVSLPEGLAAIGHDAFKRCESLSTIVLPSTLQRIEDDVFLESGLRHIYSLAATPPAITESTFDEDIYHLAALDVPAGAEEAYRASAFWAPFFEKVVIGGIVYTTDEEAGTATAADCAEDIEEAAILPSVTFEGHDYPVASIGDNAFHAMPSLAAVTVPESVASIGNQAFMDCPALAGIALPEGLEAIGSSAFANCAALQGITLPASIESIGSGAFQGAGLQWVCNMAIVPAAITEDTFDERIYNEAVLHVQPNLIPVYRTATGWKNFLAIHDDAEEFTGIADVAATSLARYANGILTTSAPASITVYAQNGAQVRHAADATTLSLAGLPGGIYIIGIEMDGQRQVMKVLH